MLRAYDYVENISGRTTIQSTERFNQELKLAKDAVDRVLQLESDTFYCCPGCNGSKFVSFFTKWNVEYFRCTECGSVFAEVDGRTLEAYQNDTELCRFRSSEDYQQEAIQKRALAWHELLDWMTFRSFRYLGRNRDMCVLSGGDRYTGFVEMLRQNQFCKKYLLLHDIRSETRAEIGLSLNLIQQTNQPKEHLIRINQHLEKGALLFLSARTGTGFDILVLREHAQIYPYEYVSLLSRRGIENILRSAGFELLDYSTPGSMDVGYVQNKQAFIPQNELFIKNLIGSSEPIILGEFQRFLQKSGMSSYAHIVAKKVEEK